MSAVRTGRGENHFKEVKGVVSRKNNVNTDHYKTAGRGRPGEVALARQSAETRMAEHSRLRTRRRLTRLRGLSAKRLSERRRLQRQAGLC